MPGGMPKSFSHSNLPMHYSGPSMMPYQGTMAPSRWMVRTLPKLTQSAGPLLRMIVVRLLLQHHACRL